MGFVNLSGHGEHGVVRLIVLPIERLQFVDGNALNIRLIADDGAAVAVPQVCRGHGALEQDVERIVFTHLEFVSNDGKFLVQIRFPDERIHHPVGFKIERPAQVFFGG